MTAVDRLSHSLLLTLLLTALHESDVLRDGLGAVLCRAAGLPSVEEREALEPPRERYNALRPTRPVALAPAAIGAGVTLRPCHRAGVWCDGAGLVSVRVLGHRSMLSALSGGAGVRGGHAASRADDVGTRRRATAIPASHPGARPLEGRAIALVSSPASVRTHEAMELQLHISPARSSSRPQVGVGTDGSRSRTRCATTGSSVTRMGAATAYCRSGNDTLVPASYLIAEDPEPARSSRPNGPLGHNAPFPAPSVGDRCHLIV